MENPGAVFLAAVLALILVLEFHLIDAGTGFCSDRTTEGNSQNAACVFPFTYNGFGLSACTQWNDDSNRPWCATTNSYVSDKKWGYCVYECNGVAPPDANCTVSTEKGDVGHNNAICVFPFTYKGQQYSTCIDINSESLWCSVTANYEADKKWGQCIIHSTNNDGQCVFPFEYRRANGHTTRHHQCITEDTMHNRSWCGTASLYDASSGSTDWGYCRPLGHCAQLCDVPPCTTPRVTPTISVSMTTPLTTPTTALMAALTTPTPIPLTTPTTPHVPDNSTTCQVYTENNSTCVFPFTYKGNIYNNCTTEGHTQPWCATSVNYPSDNTKWSNCIIETTVNKTRCVFPFEYNGKQYRECTTDGGMNKPWCSTSATFHGFDIPGCHDWGYCNLNCSDKEIPKCPPRAIDCNDTFEVFNHTLSYGGIYTNYTDFNSCRDGCLALTWCAAFDYDTVMLKCFFHNDSFLNNVHRPADCVNQLRRVRCKRPPVVSTTRAPCADTFNKFEKTGSFGGNEISAGTKSECLNKCLLVSDCVAFDFDSSMNKCFKHVTGYLDNKFDNADQVDQYRRVPCEQPASTPASTPPGGCVDTFTMQSNTLTSGGVLVNGISTTEACKRKCLESSTCMGFDFDTRDDRCYMHKSGFADNAISANDGVSGVNQYRRVPCQTGTSAVKGETITPTTASPEPGTTCTYEKVALTLSFNGMLVDGATSAEKCLVMCSRRKPPCRAFDYNSKTSECYAHHGNYEDNDLSPVDGVDQYRLSNCGCVDTFTMQSNTLTSGGVLVNGISTSEACKRKCLESSTCMGFDFDTSDDRCYMHKSGFADNAISANDGVSGVNQYRRVACLTGTSAAKGETITPTTASPKPDCLDGYEKIGSMMVYGGQLIDGATTVPDCQNDCSAKKKCLGFDFSETYKECYIHMNNDLTNKAVVSGVDHYRKIPCDSDPDCPEQFTRFPNTLSLNGKEQTGVHSLSDCQRNCKNNVLCHAFDFDNQINACFFHRQGYLEFVRESVNGVTDVDQYRKQNCADGSTEPATAKATNAIISTKMSTPTTPITNAVTPPNIKDCSLYTQYPNTMSYFGIQMDADSFAECKAVCSRMANCYAFDIDSNNGCFIHNSVAYRDKMHNTTDVTQYRKNC